MGNSSVREHHQHDDDQAPTMVAQASIASSTSDADSRTYDNWSDTTQPYVSSHVCGEGQLLPTVFRWDGNGKEVYISTSHDNWQAKIPLVKSRHDFFTVVDLPLGPHQYKYFVDGQWLCDPKEETIPNSFGTQNNVMSVKQTDFEVFEALGVDSISTGHMDDDFSSSKYYRPRSPPGDYTKIIPPKETRRRVVPPILPQHLLQIILNQEVPKHCEPFLLPEPNHVMLNHLYALSIKDGVMILSTTHRYRKKYVTTVLYKPI